MAELAMADIDKWVEVFRQQIEQRNLPRGYRMESIRAAASRCGLSRYALTAVYERLEAMGVLEARQGSGFYVCRTPQAVRNSSSFPTDDVLDVALLIRGLLDRNDLVKCGSGTLPPDWLEELELSQHIKTVASLPATNVYSYGLERGFQPLLELVQLKLEAMQISVRQEQLMLTRGVTEALNYLIRALLSPGDTVLVEAPSYYNLIGLLRLAGMQVIAIERQPDGPDLQQLQEAIEQHHPKAFFLQSILHNPTGSSISPGKAFRLVSAAEKAGMFLIEDDIYGDLADPALIRLATLDQLDKVIYVSGFSKTVSADLRVGFIAASADIMARLSKIKLLESITGSEFVEKVVYHSLSRGNYKKHIDRLRTRLFDGRRELREVLLRHGWQCWGSDEDSSDSGDGMFVWTRHPDWSDSLELAQHAARAGLWVAPGKAFVTRDVSPWIRLNVAYNCPKLFDWLAQPGQKAGTSVSRS
ncbi:PLP-dependent aminotransferase family protein [Pokkaliibacter plantistimulans]|uniref:PLP-dependent aminotransferase family protein n=1 Tax=Proteobacteria bacterium 228 TaxID=2083153 RepID=A0A2S5KX73_9PROT|nr:PLP-dependent aminotransferase family protein [Pokkaliibacter plantistimulans]PPC79308.1 PLP-dependent aminotransferase family protein [Pokkaliibacter plantistimulans]